jgi:hypothetical protein
MQTFDSEKVNDGLAFSPANVFGAKWPVFTAYLLQGESLFATKAATVSAGARTASAIID